MDEDTPELGNLSGPLDEGNLDNAGASSSTTGRFKKKSNSEMDLKLQFEEFSRSLSFRRTGSRKKLPNVVSSSSSSSDQEKSKLRKEEEAASSPSEALEDEDTVGTLGPLLPHLGYHGEQSGFRPVEYPSGFSLKSRPSI